MEARTQVDTGDVGPYTGMLVAVGLFVAAHHHLHRSAACGQGRDLGMFSMAPPTGSKVTLVSE